MLDQDADYREQREAMVRNQLVPRGISSQRVVDAMMRVPRHLFVDASLRQRAYDDSALPIGEGQTISQPYMVAVMTQLLELQGSEKVLEIGTGSGYQAAVLAELGADVYTIERKPLIAAHAAEVLRSLSYGNVHVRTGDGTLGWPEASPFDAIIITAAAPAIPGPLISQLSMDGVLVIPVGSRFSQEILKVKKTPRGLEEERHTPCMFVPLIGSHGWKEED